MCPKLDDTWKTGSSGVECFKCAAVDTKPIAYLPKKKFLGHSLMGPEWRGRAAHPPALVGDNATALLVTQGATPSFCYFDA